MYTGSKVKIRNFMEKDLDKVYKIECKSFPQPWAKLEFQFVSKLRNIIFLIAESDGLLAGYIVAMRERLPFLKYSSSSGRILNLAVHLTFRRRGIGSRLLKEAVRLLGVRYVCLEVRRSNNTAKNFYLKMGFKPAGIIPLYYGEEDAVKMVKAIEISTPPPQNGDENRR